MWTPTTRERPNRKALRYQTDLADAERAVMEARLPHQASRLPLAFAAKRFAALAHDDRWLARFGDDGRFERINHALVMADRERLRARPGRTRLDRLMLSPAIGTYSLTA